ncbi:hypothetical protein BaRGS_00025579 [Batillaria attramentaria]|uniref:Ribosomal protein L37 n=1 Tax=Batillaria attramentaria TaxID=370345 RepID=A0ABD0K7W5_9CAEN
MCMVRQTRQQKAFCSRCGQFPPWMNKSREKKAWVTSGYGGKRQRHKLNTSARSTLRGYTRLVFCAENFAPASPATVLSGRFIAFLKA